jgi:eukaryotic-like serine/threonine-protein kinase
MRREPRVSGAAPRRRMSQTNDTLAPNTHFGRYVIGRLLGVGGMGAVYEATHADLRRRVAIKTLHPDGARDPLWRARFFREAQAVARLDHPNVVSISDVGMVDDVPFIAMERLEGEDLADALARDRAWPVERLVDVMIPLLDAVAAAHEVGIVHRDIKPENIYLSNTRHRDIEPKLLDFGISKLVDLGTDNALTATHTMMGTTLYMSPEQAQNSKDVDGRADQYSLGVVLYVAATGRHPFAEAGSKDSLFELLSAIVHGRFAPPRAVLPSLPAAFEAVVMRAMATRAVDRFESVSAMARALLPLASVRVSAVWGPRLARRNTTAPVELSALPSDAPSDRSGTLVRGAPSVPSDTRSPPSLAGVTLPTQTPHAAPIAPASPLVSARPTRARSPRHALLAGVGVASLAGLAALMFAMQPSATTPSVARPAAPVRATHTATAPVPVDPVREASVAPAPVAATAPDAATTPDPSSVDEAAAAVDDAGVSRRAHHRRHTHGNEPSPRAPADAPHIYY